MSSCYCCCCCTNECAKSISSESYTYRRSAVEHELDASPAALTQNAVFDETGHFLLYASLLGIKMVNVETNRVIKTLGRIESAERFLHIALFQGVPKVDSQLVKVSD